MKLYPSISDDLAAWASRQPVFFTGSAPIHGKHINVSPKGLASSHLAFLDPNTVLYIDRTGSGCETISHCYENGRLTLMFMSFGPAPRILRLFCRSRAVESDTPDFEKWKARVVEKAGLSDATPPDFNGARAIFICHIWQAQTSCGFGVPMVRKELYDPNVFPAAAAADDDGKEGKRSPSPGGLGENELSVFEERPTLEKYWQKRTDDGTVTEYQVLKNTRSLDGLPGLRLARRKAGERLWLAQLQARVKRALAETDGILLGFLLCAMLLGPIVWGSVLL